MSDYSNLTIITPTLNEVENISELINELTNTLPSAFIIVSDDGSSDGTREKVLEIEETNSHVSLLDRSNENIKGLTASIIHGIREANTEYFCVIDADLQHPPEVLKELHALLISGCDISAGRRNPYKENQGIHRIIVTKVATLIAKIYFKIKGISVNDPMSGLFAAKKDYVLDIINKDESRFEPKGYKVLFDILKAAPRGTKFKDVLYQFRFRTGGESKMQAKHAWYFLRGLLK